MRHTSFLAWMFPGLILGVVISTTRAADPPKTERRAAAVCSSESGTWLRREAVGKEWKIVANKEELMTGDLLLGTLDSALTSLNGAIQVANKGDHADLEPLPVLETGIVLQPTPKDADFEFTLERGRIRVTNAKKTGMAKVRITIHGRATDYELPNPGDSFALEIYGRWPKGMPFKKNAPDSYCPTLAVVYLQLKGETRVKGPRVDTVMKAPPGVALFISDNIDHENPEPPQYLEKLPNWAQEGNLSELMKKRKEALTRFRKAVQEKPLGDVLDQFVKSDDPYDRRAAIVIMGATDDLDRLANSLFDAKHPDVWDNAVITLRHWIGRCPCQDQKLFDGLVEKRKYKPAQAEAVLTLLHSFSDEDLADPATFELLMDYMESDKMGLRGLAYWHLKRLVPQGLKFNYDPLESEEKRKAALAEWRKLIPSGKLPPKLKLEDTPKPKDN